MQAVRPWHAEVDGLVVRVRVTPRAGRDAVAGLYAAADGVVALAVKVRAAPADGEANEAVRRCLAEAAGRPASAVSLRTGMAARLKTLAITGDAALLAAALEKAIRPSA